jgi:signal peptidase I
VPELEQALRRERQRASRLAATGRAVCALATVAAVSVLVAVLLLPVLRIYGASMTPTLTSGDIVVSVANSKPERGSIVSFYYNNKVLVKRVIAVAGDWVDIGEDGTVYVNSEPLEEPYLSEKALGDCTITLPCQVPEGKIFVLGDHRSVSQDSRSASIGCVSEEMLVGTLVFRVWPLSGFGFLS